MHRAVTAIYRSHATATLVRDELERLGLGRHDITIIPDADQGQGATSQDLTEGAAGRDFAVTAPRYADTVPAYTDVDPKHGDAFDALHDLHLPEADARIYQQAIRNGDHVVSVEVDEDADVARIQEVMRRPEDAYDFDDLSTRHSEAGFTPRRRPPQKEHDTRVAAEREDDQLSPYTRYYRRGSPLWPRGGL